MLFIIALICLIENLFCILSGTSLDALAVSGCVALPLARALLDLIALLQLSAQLSTRPLISIISAQASSEPENAEIFTKRRDVTKRWKR